jgi:hypothetical protein
MRIVSCACADPPPATPTAIAAAQTANQYARRAEFLVEPSIVVSSQSRTEA